MDEKCIVCVNYYEVFPTCEKNGVKFKGYVEDKKQGCHDNVGYVCNHDEMEKWEDVDVVFF